MVHYYRYSASFAKYNQGLSVGDLPRYPPTATIRIKAGILITSAALCGEGLMEEREAMASSQCCLKGGNIQEMKILSEIFI